MKRLQSNTQSQQIVRRIISNRDNSQLNAVNKINNLSGVSMQPTKIVRCPIPQSSQQSGIMQRMCFICDETIVGHASIITETETTSSHEKITKKIAKMVGDSFCVIVSEDDCICRRCLSLFNSMDKAEYDLETYRSRLRGFVNKKYGIEDDEPPSKVQRMSAMDSSVRSASESFKLRNESQSNLTSSPPKKGPMKLYKCIACDFKTTDLNAFQPHSSVCKGNPNRAKTPPPRQTTVVQSRMQIMNTNRLQKVGETTITRNVAQTQKTTQQRTPPQRAVPKLRPYKCKMCLERFETRESAQIHARIHTSQLKSNQERRIQIQNSSNQNRAPTQKPLTEIIKEALSEDDQEGEVLEFHSCTECSLTFVNKKLYIQHMKTHDNSTEKSIEKNQSQYNKSQDTLGDLESIFEKMHSENSHTTATNGDKNVMVTTQEGGITYNITIPQDEDIKEDNRRIDMPSLSSHDNEEVHVSMPSLHDDERSQEEKELQGEEVPMDLEEMPGSEGQQLKFIVDENGQFLQLDNHILTTDAEGNQILVGVDGNQVLVQLQGGDESLDSEGAIQMALSGQGEGQGLILVQGPDGESQLIDASMLQQTEDGNLVLQQDIDGQTHLIATNGQVSFGEGHHVLGVPEGEEGQQVFIQGMETESAEHKESEENIESGQNIEEAQTQQQQEQEETSQENLEQSQELSENNEIKQQEEEVEKQETTLTDGTEQSEVSEQQQPSEVVESGNDDQNKAYEVKLDEVGEISKEEA